jgi:hypothetical protein
MAAEELDAAGSMVARAEQPMQPGRRPTLRHPPPPAPGDAARGTVADGAGAIGLRWWLLIPVFFAPDLSMLGYLAGPRVGAILYNAAHSYVAPLALGALAIHAPGRAPFALCLLWLAHIGFDRALGYGLKYGSAFSDTHLGHIGRQR